MGVNYTPGATHWEIVEMFRIAAKYGASVHVHLRYGGLKGTQYRPRRSRGKSSPLPQQPVLLFTLCTSPAWA